MIELIAEHQYAIVIILGGFSFAIWKRNGFAGVAFAALLGALVYPYALW